MEQIFQSSILQALGWALADSLWQMALLWLLYQLLVVLPVRHEPAQRHMGATLALFLGGIWFLGNVIYKLIHAPETRGIGNSRMDPTLMTWLEGLLPYLSAAYLLILVVLLIKFLRSVIVVQRLRITDNQLAGDWQAFVDEMALRFFIARKVLVRMSEAVDVPATIGYLKPVILLPIASVNNLSTAQVEAIIMHELAHIRRHDYLINLLVTLVETILFFNPFTHLLSRQVRKECELCCDDAVLSRNQDPGQYAYALLLLEKNRQQVALAMAATGTEGLLLGRVKRILKQPEQKVTYRQRVLALLLVTGLIMGLTLITPAKKEKVDSVMHDQQTAQVMDATSVVHPTALWPAMSAVREEDRRETPVPKAKKAAQVSETFRRTVVSPNLDWEEDYTFNHAPDFPSMMEMPIPPPPPTAPKAPAAPHQAAKAFMAFPPFDKVSTMVDVQDLAEIPQVLEELTKLVRVRGIEDKSVRALFKAFSQDKVRAEQDFRQFNQDMQQWQQAQQWNEVNEHVQEQVNIQGKMAEDRVRMIRVQRAAEEKGRIIAPGRKFKGTERGPASPEDAEVVAEKPGYRAYTFSAPSTPHNKPRVKTYKDENGFTISIVDEVGQIRLQFSSDK